MLNESILKIKLSLTSQNVVLTFDTYKISNKNKFIIIEVEVFLLDKFVEKIKFVSTIQNHQK